MLKEKCMAIMIALLLTISIVSSIALVNAHNTATDKSVWQIPTYAYVVAAPDPIGVGQEAHVYMWLDPVYGAAGGTSARLEPTVRLPAQHCCPIITASAIII